METFSTLLALCAGNSQVTSEFPAQKPETRSFHVFFDLRLNKWLIKQSSGWWFETPSGFYDAIVMVRKGSHHYTVHMFYGAEMLIKLVSNMGHTHACVLFWFHSFVIDRGFTRNIHLWSPVSRYHHHTITPVQVKWPWKTSVNGWYLTGKHI